MWQFLDSNAVIYVNIIITDNNLSITVLCAILYIRITIPTYAGFDPQLATIEV